MTARPWEESAVAPRVAISPDVGVGVGGSRELAGGAPSGSAAGAAGAGPHLLVGRATVAAPGPSPRIGLAAARVVAPAGPEAGPDPAQPPADPSPSPPPAVVPVSDPSPAPTPQPASESVPTARPSRPVRVVADFGAGPGGRTAASVGVGTVSDGLDMRIREGVEYALGFSFYVETMVYGRPGSDNLILVIRGDAGGDPSFGLQLWDFGERGLWSSGEAMGGFRFLAPTLERTWHRVLLHFLASSGGEGFYELFLDGAPIDVGVGISLIPAGSAAADVELGLFRTGKPLAGSSEIRFDGIGLAEGPGAALPPAEIALP